MNKPILITGCQRSGTTLLHLILDSHPDNTGIDETVFSKVPLSDYLNDLKYHPYVSFKLPAASYQADFIKTIPGIKVVWCVRDPRDVVLSMINLKVKISDYAVLPWVMHPEGAMREIENIAITLQKICGMNLSILINTYREIASKQPALWSLEEQVYVASLCWRIKQQLLSIYDELEIPYRILPYESLVNNPEHAIRDVLDFVGLPWHDNVMNHHQLHSGESVGSTVNTRPIDNSSTGKWAKEFDTQTLSIIQTVCSDTAAKFGYRLAGG
ncbi:MAG: sulfotransferase [Gallionellaceae bacterium]